MSEQSPLPMPEKGDITVTSPVIGQVVVIGHDAQIHFTLQVRGASDGTLHLEQENPLFQTLLQALQAGAIQAEQLRSLGLKPEIVQPTLDTETLRLDAPFASPIGLPPPLVNDPSDVSQPFTALEELLEQIDQQVGGTLQTVSGDQQRLNPVDLYLQQGNLAFWRFRQSATRLFAGSASPYYLAQAPDSTQPELQTFHTAARSQLEVLRGWVLFQKYRNYRPEMFVPVLLQDLSQGRWREVLDVLVTQNHLSRERAQNEQAYLQALGESYDAQQTQTDAEAAERYFSEALRRHPGHSVVLVNLGALKAELAIVNYIETGRADRRQLQEARDLLAQAQAMLADRPDEEGRLALAQCLLYEATSLPPDADLAAIQWAGQQTQQLRVAMGQEEQARIQWELVQRNLARRDPSFVDRQKLEQARDLLLGVGIGAGATAALLLVCQQWLAALSQLLKFLQGGMKPGGGQLPSTPHPQPPVQHSQPPKTTPRVPLGTTFLIYTRHSGPINAIAWSPDGKHIASGSEDKTVHIWNAISGHRLFAYQGHSDGLSNKHKRELTGVLSVAWSPSGTYIASTSADKTVHVWEASTGRKLLTYRGHSRAVTSVAWSPDGRHILSGSRDSTAQLWEVITGRRLFVSDDQGWGVNAVAWSPVGERIAWAKESTVWIIDRGGQILSYQDHPAGHLAWSPDGQILALANYRMLHLFEIATGQTRLIYQSPPFNLKHLKLGVGVRCLAWSPDGVHIASGHPDCGVQIWEAVSGRKIFTYLGHTPGISGVDPHGIPWSPPGPSGWIELSSSVKAMGWSPDGSRIASGGFENTVRVWQAQ